ncbi:4262_t:CDS:2, partial [Racocetra fulgida]
EVPGTLVWEKERATLPLTCVLRSVADCDFGRAGQYSGKGDFSLIGAETETSIGLSCLPIFLLDLNLLKAKGVIELET